MKAAVGPRLMVRRAVAFCPVTGCHYLTELDWPVVGGPSGSVAVGRIRGLCPQCRHLIEWQYLAWVDGDIRPLKEGGRS